ncbi:ABC transporter substrate-binding protein [Azoarcus olearius]|uniref:Regulatory lipoprotein n=1 Tax=Azoarcus sp. (strain BH72) TaxID=418699 RepID=A1KC95_AZOSB|nr:extracellular solute-binding protein [Azoarcus olearius]CAL96451.1 putative regulatory lipoprotein [Azoarcus olearius]
MNSALDEHGRRRRRLLQQLAGGSAALAAGLRAHAAAPARVTVMTAYPEEVMARVEAAFERAHPEYRLQLLWRMPHDALPYLSQPGQGGVDVYWSASPRTFGQLKAAGAFRRLEIATAGLPDRIGRTPLADPDGYYRATEMAGFGFVLNPGALAALGVAPPTDWPALADPRLAGRIVLPNPARVGFAPVLVDIVLQAYGWTRGWALWSEIAGLANWVGRGGTSVSDEVVAGRAALGVSIDFFVASAMANGAPLRFVYPARGGINPAHVAITAATSNPAGARAFAAFVLSAEGQRILTHPDIRKLPVRPAAYEGLPADYPRPFEAAAHGAYDYDNDAGRERLAVVAALFEQSFVVGHEQRAALWRRVHAAEAAGREVGAARRLLSTVPLGEAEASSPALTAMFRERLEGAEGAPRRVEIDWQFAAARAVGEAARLLQELGA